MECKQKENLKRCPCTWPDCPRKGICCECLKHHLKKGELPACYFSPEIEKTYDRSIENFIKNWKR
ncbi:MAG: DUF6485 family protein [Minisyncoccia bacterium]